MFYGTQGMIDQAGDEPRAAPGFDGTPSSRKLTKAENAELDARLAKAFGGAQ